MSHIQMRRTTQSKFKRQVTYLIEAHETNNTTCETCYAVSNSIVDSGHIMPVHTIRPITHAVIWTMQRNIVQKTDKLNTLPDIPINVIWPKLT